MEPQLYLATWTLTHLLTAPGPTRGALYKLPLHCVTVFPHLNTRPSSFMPRQYVLPPAPHLPTPQRYIMFLLTLLPLATNLDYLLVNAAPMISVVKIH